MQINFSNFFKNGFHFLALTVLMLCFSIFVNFRIYQIENSKSLQINSLKDFIKNNPLIIEKSEGDLDFSSIDSSKEILINVENFLNSYPNILVKNLSLKLSSDNQYLLSLTFESTFQDYIDLMDDISVKSPINSDFPFVVELSEFKLDLPALDSTETQVFKTSIIIHTL